MAAPVGGNGLGLLTHRELARPWDLPVIPEGRLLFQETGRGTHQGPGGSIPFRRHLRWRYLWVVSHVLGEECVSVEPGGRIPSSISAMILRVTLSEFLKLFDCSRLLH